MTISTKHFNVNDYFEHNAQLKTILKYFNILNDYYMITRYTSRNQNDDYQNSVAKWHDM